MPTHSDLVEVTVHLHHETKPTETRLGAVLVSQTGDKNDAVWVPKSQVEITPGGKPDVVVLDIPEWLALAKDFV